MKILWISQVNNLNIVPVGREWNKYKRIKWNEVQVLKNGVLTFATAEGLAVAKPSSSLIESTGISIREWKC